MKVRDSNDGLPEACADRRLEVFPDVQMEANGGGLEGSGLGFIGFRAYWVSGFLGFGFRT